MSPATTRRHQAAAAMHGIARKKTDHRANSAAGARFSQPRRCRSAQEANRWYKGAARHSTGADQNPRASREGCRGLAAVFARLQFDPWWNRFLRCAAVIRARLFAIQGWPVEAVAPRAFTIAVGPTRTPLRCISKAARLTHATEPQRGNFGGGWPKRPRHHCRGLPR